MVRAWGMDTSFSSFGGGGGGVRDGGWRDVALDVDVDVDAVGGIAAAVKEDVVVTVACAAAEEEAAAASATTPPALPLRPSFLIAFQAAESALSNDRFLFFPLFLPPLWARCISLRFISCAVSPMNVGKKTRHISVEGM